MPAKKKKLPSMKKLPVKKRASVKEEASPKVTSKRTAPPPEMPMKRRKVKQQEDDEPAKASTLARRPTRGARSAPRKEPVTARGRGRPSRKTSTVKEERAASPKHKFVPPKLSANRPFRKLRTQIGMPGDEQRVPTGAELTRLLGSDVIATQKSAREVADSSRAKSGSPRRVNERNAASSGEHGLKRNALPGDELYPASMINHGVTSPRRRILGYEPQYLTSSRRPNRKSTDAVEGTSARKLMRTFSEEHMETVAQERANLSADAPRSIVASVHSQSEQGYDPDIPDMCNQDCCWILNNFGSDGDHFFGVADGHGTNGQGAAKLVASQLPQYLHSTLEFPRDIPGAFKRAFKTTDEELRKSMNAKFSGSTAATLLIRGKKAYGAFVGDSRAFIARREKKSWTVVKLSNDHTPEVPEETKRILAAGGRVHPHECELYGRHRVWLKTKDGPGLAMSRSFGDSVVARVGVISEPEIIEVDLLPSDKFFILATDGVWDAMSNEAVVSLIEPFIARRDGQGAIEALIKEAQKRYMDEADRTDDTTVVLGFLDVPE